MKEIVSSNILIYMKCEKCNNQHDGKYGSGRFCSCECARSFSTTIKREEIKVVILWNGNWHRKKLMRKHSVKQVKNRDKIKISEILKAGYAAYVIDDYRKFNRKFVESEFNKFMVG